MTPRNPPRFDISDEPGPLTQVSGVADSDGDETQPFESIEDLDPAAVEQIMRAAPIGLGDDDDDTTSNGEREG